MFARSCPASKRKSIHAPPRKPQAVSAGSTVVAIHSAGLAHLFAEERGDLIQVRTLNFCLTRESVPVAARGNEQFLDRLPIFLAGASVAND
jgi:hypothetical protein